MRRCFAVLCALAVWLSVSACRAVPEDSLSGASRDHQRALAVGNDVLKAIQNNDYKVYKEYFGDMVTEQEFHASQKSLHAQFGTLEKYEFIASLETPLVDNNIWRVTFKRKDSKGKIVLQQVLFRFVSGIGDDGKFRVIGMAFL